MTEFWSDVVKEAVGGVIGGCTFYCLCLLFKNVLRKKYWKVLKFYAKNHEKIDL